MKLAGTILPCCPASPLYPLTLVRNGSSDDNHASVGVGVLIHHLSVATMASMAKARQTASNLVVVAIPTVPTTPYYAYLVVVAIPTVPTTPFLYLPGSRGYTDCTYHTYYAYLVVVAATAETVGHGHAAAVVSRASEPLGRVCYECLPLRL